MKKNVEAILEEYENIISKLFEKPTSIEHIYEMKDWMETIPMTVRGLDDQTRRYVMDYEVLEQFWYNLPQEDFVNKWTAIGWPLKVAKTVEQIEIFLIEETERLYKIQLQDEVNLHERIEVMTVQVVNLSSVKDFSKVIDNVFNLYKFLDN